MAPEETVTSSTFWVPVRATQASVLPGDTLTAPGVAVGELNWATWVGVVRVAATVNLRR